MAALSMMGNRVLNEDMKLVLLHGGKEGTHRDTMEMSIMFRPLPPPSLCPPLS